MPIQKTPETGALQAMATRQCQKSGNGFPPDAAFLPLGTHLTNTTEQLWERYFGQKKREPPEDSRFFDNTSKFTSPGK
ncbi:hypothetical protein [Pseudomonas sp. BF-R-24]|uniref:hypothetical protein n=1 Tax=Pseudomonas sp. BF-R-24 TaxID=2832386 RepID=UPI001CBC6552|nr:hypothetical protein [Pseudomonas sp. BF-R-24]